MNANTLIPNVIFPSLRYYITRVISDNRIRREFIHNNATNDIIQKLFLENRQSDRSGNLKWGIVSVAMGLALACLQVTNLQDHDPLTYGILFIFRGTGLLLSYYLQARIEKS